MTYFVTYEHQQHEQECFWECQKHAVVMPAREEHVVLPKWVRPFL